MKFYVIAHLSGPDPLKTPFTRIADVVDVRTGLALIRGYLPQKVFTSMSIVADAVRGKGKKPAQVLFTCTHDLESGKWVILDKVNNVKATGPDLGTVLESGVL